MQSLSCSCYYWIYSLSCNWACIYQEKPQSY